MNKPKYPEYKIEYEIDGCDDLEMIQKEVELHKDIMIKILDQLCEAYCNETFTVSIIVTHNGLN